MTLTRTSTLKAARQKKCATCREKFTPRTTMHTACSPACAGLHAITTRKKAEAKSDREARYRLRTRGEWLADVQKTFNAYIRERDKDQPCICCGKFFDEKDHLTGGLWDAGHYISRGAAQHLRFVEDNVHKQLKGHNRPGGTTRAQFRAGMIARIGLERLEALEGDQTTRHYSSEELRELKAVYADKLKKLKRANQ